MKLRAQVPVQVQVSDSSTGQPVPAVTITIRAVGTYVTDTAGSAHLALPIGNHTLVFSSTGYRTVTKEIVLQSQPLTLAVQLATQAAELDDVIMIATTRSQLRIEQAPQKVEVLGPEEMMEESTIKPASIASILGDVSGIQVQQTSPVNGNSNIRIQGLEGRYTQLLRDGMPLYDGFSGGFGVTSIPPLDLQQIELIKGPASTLYGGGAIGGLINLISKKPGPRQELTAILNQTTLKESNGSLYASRRYKRMGYTYYGGGTRQFAVDVNHDGFSDVPHLWSLVIHPRLFWYPAQKVTVSLGYTMTMEDRHGGDMLALKEPAPAGHRYFEDNDVQRHSLSFELEAGLGARNKLLVKSGWSSFGNKVEGPDLTFNGRQLRYFEELSLLVPYRKNNLVVGVTANGDQFSHLSSPPPFPDYSNTTFGVFAQHTWQWTSGLTLETGLRDDYHTHYGNFLLPEMALFYRISKPWAVRAGIGWGYKIPDPLSPQLIDYSIQMIQPISPTVKAERSTGYHAEVNYKFQRDKEHSFFINQAFFLTVIDHPLIVTEENSGAVVFSTGSHPVITRGSDTYIKLDINGWEWYLGYTYTIARRNYLSDHAFLPLTPMNRMAFTVAKDWEEHWRLGLEGSYTGTQYRLDKTKTPGYFFLAALLERKIGQHLSIVLNGENLLDFRQSRKESLYTGSIMHPVFVPLWAPVDGRVINVCLRMNL